MPKGLFIKCIKALIYKLAGITESGIGIHTTMISIALSNRLKKAKSETIN